MTDETPITLDDIIKMDDVSGQLESQSIAPKKKPAEKKEEVIPVPKKTDPKPKKTIKQDKATKIIKPKKTSGEMLVEIKTIPEDIKIKENSQQRIFERVCANCHHIFFSDIPIKYFYADGKRGQNYKIIKLPTNQYPANIPKNILEMIESRECPKCRK